MVVNVVRKGEIACYKQFLLFSLSFPQLISLMRQNSRLCGNGLNTLQRNRQLDGITYTAHAYIDLCKGIKDLRQEVFNPRPHSSVG